MKIGIVTFQRAHNYGAVLQSFALQETLKSLGADIEIIDYHCSAISDVYWDGWPKISPKYPVRSIKNIIKSILWGYRHHKRYCLFNAFIKDNLNLSTPFNHDNLSGLNKYHAIVYGSDQIWNRAITNDEGIYFGDGFKGIKVAYAASAGKDEPNIKNHEYQLLGYKAIGIREKSLASFLENSILPKAIVTLDPTLLFNAKDWIERLNLNKRQVKEKYVLVYPLRERIRTIEMSRKLAESNNCRLIEIGAQITRNRMKNRLEYVGPIEFLSYILHADYVVTNSFHGTAFSIIFQKNFYTIKINDGEDGRSINLLNELKLSDRLKELDDELISNNIDYSFSNIILDKRRMASKSFLIENLGL